MASFINVGVSTFTSPPPNNSSCKPSKLPSTFARNVPKAVATVQPPQTAPSKWLKKYQNAGGVSPRYHLEALLKRGVVLDDECEIENNVREVFDRQKEAKELVRRRNMHDSAESWKTDLSDESTEEKPQKSYAMRMASLQKMVSKFYSGNPKKSSMTQNSRFVSNEAMEANNQKSFDSEADREAFAALTSQEKGRVKKSGEDTSYRARWSRFAAYVTQRRLDDAKSEADDASTESESNDTVLHQDKAVDSSKPQMSPGKKEKAKVGMSGTQVKKQETSHNTSANPASPKVKEAERRKEPVLQASTLEASGRQKDNDYSQGNTAKQSDVSGEEQYMGSWSSSGRTMSESNDELIERLRTRSKPEAAPATAMMSALSNRSSASTEVRSSSSGELVMSPSSSPSVTMEDIGSVVVPGMVVAFIGICLTLSHIGGSMGFY